MKYLMTTIALLCSGLFFAQSYEAEIQALRDSADAEFSNPEFSILDSATLANFHGLDYYPIDSSYKIEVKFKRKSGPVFEMPTSTERLPKYRLYGYLIFKWEGKKYKLALYQNQDLMKKEGYEDYLFCPFMDLTNGIDTYGAGRYLDYKISDLENPTIDFNLCYNPYCAYNYRYSCPIPPKENHLPIEIKAGVKSLPGH